MNCTHALKVINNAHIGGNAILTGGYQCVGIYAGRCYCNYKCQADCLFDATTMELVEIKC